MGFQIKHHDDGSIELYKTRFVAKLFHQQPDLDSNETSSPNAKPIKIRTFSLLMCLYIYIYPLDSTSTMLLLQKKKKTSTMLQPRIVGEERYGLVRATN